MCEMCQRAIAAVAELAAADQDVAQALIDMIREITAAKAQYIQMQVALGVMTADQARAEVAPDVAIVAAVNAATLTTHNASTRVH